MCYVPKPFMAWSISPTSVSQNSSRAVREMLSVVNKAAALMRSDEFCNDFPESFVAKWKRNYFIIIAESFLLNLIFGSRFLLRLSGNYTLRRWRTSFHKMTRRLVGFF